MYRATICDKGYSQGCLGTCFLMWTCLQSHNFLSKYLCNLSFFQGSILINMCMWVFNKVRILLRSASLHTFGFAPGQIEPLCSQWCIIHLTITRKALSALFPDIRSRIVFCQTYSVMSYLLEMPDFHPLSSPVICAEWMWIAFVRSRPLWQDSESFSRKVVMMDFSLIHWSAYNKTNEWKAWTFSVSCI